MNRFLLVVAAALAAAAAANASTSSREAATAAPSCKNPTIGIMGPFTGPVASVGLDQLHWAQFALAAYNRANPKHKVKLVQGDSQLDPSKASVVAQQFASTRAMLAMVGPSGSQEVIAASPILNRAGFGYVSSSATRVDLTDGHLRGFFYRVVPNDGVQGPTDATFAMAKLGVKAGDRVMDVDNQNAYSTGLSDIIDKTLRARGVTVDRESISSTSTDYSSLVAKVSSSTKVVFLTWQVAGNAQLFASQMKEQGKRAIVFGTDGVFDNTKFTANGAYVSFFAPDVGTVPGARAIVNAFRAKYGDPGPFGAPTYVATQVILKAVKASCKNGKTSRAEVRRLLAKTTLKTTILGNPMSFTANGDVKGAKFYVFKIVDGKYVTQQ